MAAPREFGLELCLKAQSEDIKTKSDIILILVHWRLLRHSFLCVGDVHYVHSIPSELLPINLGWNGDDGTYLIKYSYKRKLYMMALLVEPGNLLTVRLWADQFITSVRLNIGTVLTDELVINLQKCLTLCRVIDRDLIEKQLMGADVFEELDNAVDPTQV